MKTTKSYYKVLTPERKSFIINNRNMTVTYPVDEWVKPKIINSRLMAFIDYRAAKEWADCMLFQKLTTAVAYRIVDCNVLHPRDISFVYRIGKSTPSRSVIQFWNVWNNHKRQSYDRLRSTMYDHFCYLYHNLPPDSVGGTAIKCLE